MAGGTRWALAAVLLYVPASAAWWVWPAYAHANAATAGDALVVALLYLGVLAPALMGAAGLTWPGLGNWLWTGAAALVAGGMVLLVAGAGWKLGDWTWVHLVLPAAVCGLFAAAVRGRVRTAA